MSTARKASVQKENDMQETIDRLKNSCRTQVELSRRLCDLALDHCERLTEINSETARQFLAQTETDREALQRGDIAGCIVASTRIATAHMTSALSSSMDWQRQVLASLAPK